MRQLKAKYLKALSTLARLKRLPTNKGSLSLYSRLANLGYTWDKESESWQK